MKLLKTHKTWLLFSAYWWLIPITLIYNDIQLRDLDWWLTLDMGILSIAIALILFAIPFGFYNVSFKQSDIEELTQVSKFANVMTFILKWVGLFIIALITSFILIFVQSSYELDMQAKGLKLTPPEDVYSWSIGDLTEDVKVHNAQYIQQLMGGEIDAFAHFTANPETIDRVIKNKKLQQQDIDLNNWSSNYEISWKNPPGKVSTYRYKETYKDSGTTMYILEFIHNESKTEAFYNKMDY